MSLWQVVYSEQATMNLRNIYEYIAYDLLVPETAKRQARRIMDAIEALNDMPERSPLYEKEPWRSRGLRKLIVDYYIAFYLPIEKSNQILITSIMYGGRNIEELI